MDANPRRTPVLRPSRSSGRRRRLPRTAALTLGVYLVVLAANRSLVEVRGPSMLPALWPGDRVLTLPAIGRLRAGQAVVVRDPRDAGHLVVKRVHAVTGEGIDVRGDHAAASTDSRTWGPLARSAVRRRVVARWPDLRGRP